MKVLVSWLADHIKIPKKELNPAFVAEQLAAKTAEIDAVHEIRTDVSQLFASVVTQVNESEVLVECLELKKKILLPVRKDALHQQIFLIKSRGNDYAWATLADVGSAKEGLFPSVQIAQHELRGSWKDTFETEDTVLVIENKALTNRPDLWGHRGIAREIAAILNKELIAEDLILSNKPIRHYAQTSVSSGEHSFVLEIAQQDQGCGKPCNRLAAVFLPTIRYQPSLLWMAVRLARIDARPIDMIVDMTNYVMYDIGQPMHAFDAQKIGTKKLEGRCARQGEKLVLLDGDVVTLASKDYVISNGDHALSVAGVMGGQSTAVTRSTTCVLLESAHFDAATIRRTATRLKKRTESSTRFEKTLDPNQNTDALLRYLKLLEDAQADFTVEDSMVSLGALAQAKTIEISHEQLEAKIGCQVAVDRVESILSRLGFGVTKTNQQKPAYSVVVPTYRSTKDVTIQEDLVEEVARFIGYDSIPQVYPVRAMKPFAMQTIERRRALKQAIAQGMAYHETDSYAFFDEEFLRVLQYDPHDVLRIANPLSEHWQRLVTSLIPHLLKAITSNQGHETLKFFECNRVWFYDDHPTEEYECAGIWHEMRNPVDFYEGKAQLVKLFDFFKLPIRWEKPSKEIDPWYDPYQTAHLWYEDRIIGKAGKISSVFLKRVAQGDAFIFELDANFFLNNPRAVPVFNPLQRYPSTDLDISLIVPIECTVYGIEHAIRSADQRIVSVALIDSYTRPEWTTKKGMTFRFTARDLEGTLTKEAIDSIWDHVVLQVKAIGAEVR